MVVDWNRRMKVHWMLLMEHSMLVVIENPPYLIYGSLHPHPHLDRIYSLVLLLLLHPVNSRRNISSISKEKTHSSLHYLLSKKDPAVVLLIHYQLGYSL